MKILIFLHGTLTMHKTGVGKTREDKVKQSKDREASVLDYSSYVPVGNAVEKIKSWKNQRAEILYFSSHERKEDIEKDKIVLKNYHFPEAQVYWRENGASYAEVVEKLLPDILIEDDCESIGGEVEMTYPHIRKDLKSKIKSVSGR